MKKMNAKLMGCLYVGAVYAVGAFLGYRAGRSKGRLEMYCQLKNNEIEEDLARLRQDFPEFFEEKEES